TELFPSRQGGIGRRRRGRGDGRQGQREHAHDKAQGVHVLLQGQKGGIGRRQPQVEARVFLQRGGHFGGGQRGGGCGARRCRLGPQHDGQHQRCSQGTAAGQPRRQPRC